MDVEVSVPATIANLGPGFDCLGVAVGLHLRVRFSAAAELEITGEEKVRPPEASLIYRAFREAFRASNAGPPPVRIEVLTEYPSARGLGASASAIVAGLVAAREAGDLSLTDVDLAKLAVEMEGHSDNVLPAFFGGLVVSAASGWMRFDPSDRITPLLFVAPRSMKTSDARKVVPETVPRADAVSNAAAAATLVALLTGCDQRDALLMATEDRLHQPFRLPLMPETFDLHEAMRAAGFATALAGSGPSLICLVTAERVAKASALARRVAGDQWDVLAPGWDLAGAQVR